LNYVHDDLETPFKAKSELIILYALFVSFTFMLSIIITFSSLKLYDFSYQIFTKTLFLSWSGFFVTSHCRTCDGYLVQDVWDKSYALEALCVYSYFKVHSFSFPLSYLSMRHLLCYASIVSKSDYRRFEFTTNS
jgi:hypothetical protein